jgi:proteasome accessory factor B
VSAAQVRAQVVGYPPGQDESAFLRMFERDKECLRAAGLVIEAESAGGTETYRLDDTATYAAELELTAEESMLVRAAGAAMLGDPSFPLGDDLRLALSKLSVVVEHAPVPVAGPAPVRALTADESPESQGRIAAEFLRACETRKRATFRYTDLAQQPSRRDVEPYGLFARDGRWYMVGRDTRADAMRTFAVTRVADLAVNAGRPKSPDFERPVGFDVRAYMLLPFQFGAPVVQATVRFTGSAALRAEALTAGQGRLETGVDGSVSWTVPVADMRAFAGWTVDNGPGLRIVAPEEARRALADGLHEVARSHGG